MIDLNTLPSETETKKPIRDSNKKVYESTATKVTHEITLTKYGKGTNIVIDGLPVKEKVTEDVQKNHMLL